MKVTLILPPGNQKCSEPFTLPNMSLAMLDRSLAEAGHEVKQINAEHAWFGGLKKEFPAPELEAMHDIGTVRRYVNGLRLHSPSRKILDSACARLAEKLAFEPSDIYAISLIDMRAEPLIINFSALVAYIARKKFGATVVAGSKSLSREAFFQLMRTFRVYDYGVYARRGEKPLLAVINRVRTGKGGLFMTVAREKGRLRNHPAPVPGRPEIQSPLYQEDGLKKFVHSTGEILSRYNSGASFRKLFPETGKKYLVVPYVFELTCPNNCAFCDNDSRRPSDRKPMDEIMEELSALKARGVTGLYIVNSAFNNSYKFAEELCDGMIREKFGFKWISCANLKFVDGPLLEKIKKAGAVKLTWGTETFSQKLLDYVRKGIKLEKVREILRYSDKAGILNHIELIAGLPGETELDIRSTEEFIRENSDVIDIYTMNQFHLYPDSPFGRNPRDFGLRLHDYPPLHLMNCFYPMNRKLGEYSVKFDEVGGLRWEQKNLQIARSFHELADKTRRIRGFNAAEEEHPYLLNLLYDRFGWNKKTVKKLFNALTYRFKPYNLDFFLENANLYCGCSKNEKARVLYPLSSYPLFRRKDFLSLEPLLPRGAATTQAENIR